MVASRKFHRVQHRMLARLMLLGGWTVARPALRTAKIGCATAEPEQSPQPSAALGRIGGEAQPQKAVPTTAEKQGPARHNRERRPANWRSGTGRRKKRLEGEFYAELGGEGDANCGAGAEEVAKSAGGDAELFDAGDGSGLSASGIKAESGGIA